MTTITAAPQDNFWQSRLKLNAETAIFHQWQQLEATGCIDNFRIAAGIKEGFRLGFFFADSDAYKWLEAAARIQARHPDARLHKLITDFISILEKAQDADGYLYTYNQIHFPGSRWQNLQIEHEFYCLGHLIEAGVAHHTATSQPGLISIATRAADLLVTTFMESTPHNTDGHEEVEIALIRLSRHTGNPAYRELARRLLERRGRIPAYWLHFLGQMLRTRARMQRVKKMQEVYAQGHPEYKIKKLPASNRHRRHWSIPLRFAASVLSGRYTQQHAPLLAQHEAVGHSVRFTYLNTAAAMLAGEDHDDQLRDHLVNVWQRMVSRRMYVTGGIGALPLMEGFGRDYELDPEIAYAETCAALGSIFWSREMSALTRDPRFEDLVEWQLYNAASVGIGLDGRSYFYNNPLTCRGELERAPWYSVPCCPSNLSRTWASLNDSALTTNKDSVYVNQYIPGTYPLNGMNNLVLDSGPWDGVVSLRVNTECDLPLQIFLRVPAWADEYRITLNGLPFALEDPAIYHTEMESAVGLHFERARYLHMSREFQPNDQIEIQFSMPLTLRRQDRRIPGCGGMVALTRGPVVYCLESIDNPEGVFNLAIDTRSLETSYDPDLLGGCVAVRGVTSGEQAVKFIPYMLWGNRGRSQMTVFFKDVN